MSRVRALGVCLLEGACVGGAVGKLVVEHGAWSVEGLLSKSAHALSHLVNGGGEVVSLGWGMITVVYVLKSDLSPIEVFGAREIGIGVE